MHFKTPTVLAIILALNAMIVSAQAEPPSYKPLRYDEDYTYLRDPAQQTDVFDPIKYIQLDEDGSWYLSIGGDVRERYEVFNHPNWGAGPQDQGGYSLQRYRLHEDLHYEDWFRFFGELKSGLEFGREGGPRPTDKDDADIHQLFFDLKLSSDNGASVTSRVGRQELDYGSSRLISSRQGPNVPLSFDAARAIIEDGDRRLDIFGAKPAETKPAAFDDGADPNVKLWGAYSISPISAVSGAHVDLYYLGLERHHAAFNQGTAREMRHTFGTRLWGKAGQWDYNDEFVYQFGFFGEGDISAWTAASDTGYAIDSLPWSPRVGMKVNITSGDSNPDTQNLQTFNPLFPKGAYFSEAALIGPANHADVHPSVDLKPSEKTKLTFDWDFFWRESIHDGIYGLAVNVVRPADSSEARYIGSQPQAILQYQIDRHWSLFANYAHFFAGSFLVQTGAHKDIDFFTTWLELKF